MTYYKTHFEFKEGIMMGKKKCSSESQNTIFIVFIVSIRNIK